MKIKKMLILTLSAMFAVSCFAFTACKNAVESYVQQLNYTECIEKINNPDQGFYRPVYVRVTENGVSYNKNIVNESTRLYHLRIDISAFSGAVNGKGDMQLTQSAVNGFEEILFYLKERDKNAIVRFAYDPSFNGSKNSEPSLQTMLTHIGQICAVINRYENTVTAVEAGLIGPWGEMHSSEVANAQNITPVIDKYLTETRSVPVLVRTPKMIYDYLGITLADIDGYTIPQSDKAYRLGIYNDGYLGSETDLGTYTDREREVEFLSKQTDHLPYGGEVVTPSCKLHDIEKCLPEMHKLGLSYLNVEWNNAVIDKWKNSLYTAECGDDEIYYGATAFTYIENRMGYRFVLEKSVFGYSQNMDGLQIELDVKNTGFGNLNRKKCVKILVADSEGKVVLSQSADDFTGGDKYNCSVDTDLQSGVYDVYICIYGEESDGAIFYSVRFANDGLWNEELKANKIGSIEVQAR